MELLVSDHIFCIGHSAAPHTGDHSRDRGVTWPRESSQPKLFPEATNQFQVGSRRVEQVRWPPRPRHQLTSYPGRCGGAARLASPAQPSPAQPSLDQRTFCTCRAGPGGAGWAGLVPPCCCSSQWKRWSPAGGSCTRAAPCCVQPGAAHPASDHHPPPGWGGGEAVVLCEV